MSWLQVLCQRAPRSAQKILPFWQLFILLFFIMSKLLHSTMMFGVIYPIHKNFLFLWCRVGTIKWFFLFK